MTEKRAENKFLCANWRGQEHCMRARKRGGQQVVNRQGPVRLAVRKSRREVIEKGLLSTTKGLS
jgi:hypothetical protein